MITTLTKKRVIRDFDKLDKSFRKKVLKSFPNGVTEAITYLSVQGKTVAAIPFETEDTYYLFRLSTLGSVTRSRRPDYKDDYLPADEVDEKDNDYSMSSDDQPIDYDTQFTDYDQEEDSDYYDQ